MTGKKLIVANWKMHKTFGATEEFINNFVSLYKVNIFSKQVEVVFAPSYHLINFLKNFITNLPFKISAQDCSSFSENEGAFTGDISAAMLKDAGCDYVIVGHSERKKYHKETNQQIRQKILNALKLNLKVILCVGENLQEREENKYKDVLLQVLDECLSDQITEDVVIAYEPVWAIGTGKAATLDQIKEMHEFLYESCSARFAKKLKIIYGGSVNLDNAKQILQIDKVSGLLVGGASLNPDGFYNLVKMVEG